MSSQKMPIPHLGPFMPQAARQGVNEVRNIWSVPTAQRAGGVYWWLARPSPLGRNQKSDSLSI
jgi:hypothetical protein